MKNFWKISSICTQRIGKGIILAFLMMIANLLPLAAVAEERVYFYHNDHLGSPVAITDANGNVVWKANYEPFGKATTTTETISNTHQFTGKEADSETGLYYFRARYYDPQIGRFLSFDPATRLGYSGSLRLLEPLSLNPYVYVKNNPFRWIDPLGLEYLNTNFTYCFPNMFCVIGGYLVNTDVLYLYGGAGVGSPGGGASETFSSSDPTSGLSIGYQRSYGMAYQVGYSVETGEWSTEVGEGWPKGWTAAVTYTFDPDPALDWVWEANKVWYEESDGEYNFDADYDEFRNLLIQDMINSDYENLKLPWDDNY